jgi:hypothetical protein
MLALDRTLGWIEVVLTVVSVIWLLLAALSPRKNRCRGAAIFAAALGLTIAQPFGVVASPQHVPRGASEVEANATKTATRVHILRLGPVPVMPFFLQSRPWGLTFGDSPGDTLRARSWFWLPLLTNSTHVADMCTTDSTVPCWDGSNDASSSSAVRAAPTGSSGWRSF